MFVIEKLKLNKFQDVPIQKPSAMFVRYGLHDLPNSAYTGDSDPMPMASNKVDGMKLEEMRLLDEMRQKEIDERNK